MLLEEGVLPEWQSLSCSWGAALLRGCPAAPCMRRKALRGELGLWLEVDTLLGSGVCKREDVCPLSLGVHRCPVPTRRLGDEAHGTWAQGSGPMPARLL